MPKHVIIILVIIGTIISVIISGIMASKLKEGMLSGTVPLDVYHADMSGMGGIPHHESFGPSHDASLYTYEVDNRPTEQCWYVDADRLNGYETESEDEDGIYCEASRHCSSAFRLPPPGGMPDAPRISGYSTNENMGVGKMTGAGGGMLWLEMKDQENDSATFEYNAESIDKKLSIQTEVEPTHSASDSKEPTGPTKSSNKNPCLGTPLPLVPNSCFDKTNTVIGLIQNYSSGCNLLPPNVEIANVDEILASVPANNEISLRARMSTADGSIIEKDVHTASSNNQPLTASLWSNMQGVPASASDCSRTGNPTWHSHVWVKTNLLANQSTLPNISENTNWNWMDNNTFLKPNSAASS